MELFKSFILFFLVGLSLFLSYQIWMFKPDYEPFAREKYIEKVSIGEKKSIDEVIQPYGTFVHLNGVHYEMSMKDETELFQYFKSCEIYNIKKSEKSYTKADLYQQVSQGTFLQIEFSNEVSHLFLSGLFSNIQLDNLDFSFHHLLLSLNETKEGTFYFINENTGQTFEGIFKTESWDDFKQSLLSVDETKILVAPFQFGDRQLFYLPVQGFYLEQLFFLTNQLDSEQFKNALFSDPMYAKQSGEEGNMSYTDGTRLLQEKSENSSIVYVNPLNIDIKNQKSQKFQFESYNYINSHEGFTGDFYLSDVLESNRQVVFRMYYNHLPVFGKDICTAIEVRWGDDESLSYIHPSYELGYQVEQEKVSVFLDSGYTVYEKLINAKHLDVNFVENIRIAYIMERENSFGQFVSLYPAWVVLYNGKWLELETLLTTNGGEANGLE